MILTRVTSHHDSAPIYINLDQIVSVHLHSGVDYHVEMSDGSSMHIELTDSVIDGLINDADTAYTP